MRKSFSNTLLVILFYFLVNIHPIFSQTMFDKLAAMYIENSASSNVLSGTSIDYGTKIIIGTESEEYENEWFVVQDGNNSSYYRLKNLYSSKVMSYSPDGSIEITGEANDDNQRWKLTSARTNEWEIENVKTGEYLTLNDNILSLKSKDSSASQKWDIKMVNPEYAVPEPRPINTGDYMLVAEMCNLWDVNTRPNCWKEIAPYPDRKPMTGWFDETSPKVIDWDIKLAVDHGIQVFMPCWFRSEESVGKRPVTGVYDHWINNLAKAKYKKYIKFMVMWITRDYPGLSGLIKDKKDFLENLAPYFIEHFFKNPNYFTIDNKPIMSFFYDPPLIQKLGGLDSARDAITQFREMVKNAGFSDIILLGQWCTVDSITHSNKEWKYIGMDYGHPYHWPSYVRGALLQTNGLQYYTDEQMINAQEYCWLGQNKYSLLPTFVTCTMGFDDAPWGGKMKYFRLTPNSFRQLLRNARRLMNERYENDLVKKILFLDNWDEFGEGHYIYPTEQYGFGYLNSIRQIFGNITSVKK